MTNEKLSPRLTETQLRAFEWEHLRSENHDGQKIEVYASAEGYNLEVASTGMILGVVDPMAPSVPVQIVDESGTPLDRDVLEAICCEALEDDETYIWLLTEKVEDTADLEGIC